MLPASNQAILLFELRVAGFHALDNIHTSVLLPQASAVTST